MKTIFDSKSFCHAQIDFSASSSRLFRLTPSRKTAKTLEFFDALYSYPPKFRIKWDNLNDLPEDLFMSYNYRSFKPTFPFVEVSKHLMSGKREVSSFGTGYNFDQYVNGYLNKKASTNFYNKQTQILQKKLSSIPVYVILNGQGDIVLANSTITPIKPNSKLKQAAYDLCGNFDPLAEKKTTLGLFFMSKTDAEVFLNKISITDSNGVKNVGLSIHCFGLDFAYRVMSNYSPGVDFRLIPDLQEVQTLIASKVNPSPQINFVHEQHNQSNFSQDYVKGVPIYIVKVGETSSKFWAERSRNIVNTLDTLFEIIGLRANSGSNLQAPSTTLLPNDKTKTYVFFDKEDALTFCQRHCKKVIPYVGGNSRVLNKVATKPLIFVQNLEDFFEITEDFLLENYSRPPEKTVQTSLKNLYFVPSKVNSHYVSKYLTQATSFSTDKAWDFVYYKYRRLIGFFELVLNTNQ